MALLSRTRSTTSVQQGWRVENSVTRIGMRGGSNLSEVIDTVGTILALENGSEVTTMSTRWRCRLIQGPSEGLP